jgi:hypothetical protein
MDTFKRIETTEILAGLNIKCQYIQQMGTRLLNYQGPITEEYKQMYDELNQVCEGYEDSISKIKTYICST